MLKKLLSCTLTVTMLLGVGISAFAATPSDVEGTGYEKAVSKLLQSSIISGYSDGNFQPEKPISRAEVCSMIVKATKQYDEKAEVGKSKFSDMKQVAWAIPFVNKASGFGIVSGYSNGTFKPTANITYNELSSMVVKAIGITSGGITGAWPRGYVDKATELGVFKDLVGFDAKTDGAQKATRGNVAIAISNVQDEIEKAAKAGYTVEAIGDNATTPNKDDIGYVVSNATMKFIGVPQKISLEDAIKTMQTDSVSAQTAELNKKKDEATAKGYSDSYSNMKELLKYMDKADFSTQYSYQEQGVSETGKKILQIQKEFAQENLDENYIAEMNTIKLNTISMYYGLLQAEDSLRIEKENLNVQKNILAMTQKKFNLGVASKIDSLKAETMVTKAESSVLSVQNSVNSAKMSLNMLLENPLMQEVKLTTTFVQLPVKEISLTDAINNALKNRNEIASVRYALKLQETNFNSAGIRYGERSTKYKNEQLALLQVQQASDLMPAKIEMDIRNKYDALRSKADAVNAAKETLSFAKEAYRIANISYDAGMNTISEVQDAQVVVYNANLGVSAAIAAYNQSVYDFEIAQGVGTEKITF